MSDIQIKGCPICGAIVCFKGDGRGIDNEAVHIAWHERQGEKLRPSDAISGPRRGGNDG